MLALGVGSAWSDREVHTFSLDSEVIARCRLLRAIKFNEAGIHVHAMRKAISGMLSCENPDLIICMARIDV